MQLCTTDGQITDSFKIGRSQVHWMNLEKVLSKKKEKEKRMHGLLKLGE